MLGCFCVQPCIENNLNLGIEGLCFFSVAVKFHIAHLYEVQGKYKAAKDNYEQLLKDKELPTHLKADICRQLGRCKA